MFPNMELSEDLLWLSAFTGQIDERIRRNTSNNVLVTAVHFCKGFFHDRNPEFVSCKYG